MHYLKPKLNQRSTKDLKSILILTMKQVYTYFWLKLLIGALIFVATILITFSKKHPSMEQPTLITLKQFEWFTRGTYLLDWFLCQMVWGHTRYESAKPVLSIKKRLALVGNEEPRWLRLYWSQHPWTLTQKTLYKNCFHYKLNYHF